jgi:hypothetical protein
MNPAVIEGHVTVAGRPENWDESVQGKCHGLPLRLDLVGDLQFMRSAWEPSDDELARLIAGATIELGISAPQHPVVQMGVGAVPFDSEIGARPIYVIRDMTDADGARWCRAIVVLGPHSFPAGIQISHDLPLAVASANLIRALENHLARLGLLKPSPSGATAR